MSPFAESPTAQTAPDETRSRSGDRRKGAIRAANRHTIRVRVLRWAIPLLAVGGITGLASVFMLDPFRKLPTNISVSRAGLNGSLITMDLPKLTGFRKDGRPYDVTATSAVQDITKPNMIELNELDARIGMSDNGVSHITAQTGLYDSAREVMNLKSEVRFRSDSGYDALLRSARIDLKAGTVASDEPVSVVMKNATIIADRMNMIDNGRRIIFEGNVKSVFNSNVAAAETADGLTGTTQ